MLERVVEINEGKSTVFQYEQDCETAISNVFNGEYTTQGLFIKGHPVIIDIGANLGSFSIWVLKKWDPSYVYCYEPLKSNFNQLQKNISLLPQISTKFILVNKAVEAPSTKLYANTQGPASSSFYECPFKTAEFEEVETMSAEELPECSILKVDTEGCEVDIITKYLKTHHKPILIQFEYHREKDRVNLDHLLYTYNYKLSACFTLGLGFGLYFYVDGDQVGLPIEAASRLE